MSPVYKTTSHSTPNYDPYIFIINQYLNLTVSGGKG